MKKLPPFFFTVSALIISSSLLAQETNSSAANPNQTVVRPAATVDAGKTDPAVAKDFPQAETDGNWRQRPQPVMYEHKQHAARIIKAGDDYFLIYANTGVRL
ncbi:MAG: hypothetical protein WCP60_08600 [bacterium]